MNPLNKMADSSKQRGLGKRATNKRKRKINDNESISEKKIHGESEKIEMENDGSEEELEDDIDAEDPFKHFIDVIDEDLARDLSDRKKWATQPEETIPQIGKVVGHGCNRKIQINSDDAEKMFVKQQLLDNLKAANMKRGSDQLMSEFQKRFYSVINKYNDIYYPERTHLNGEELRLCYCLHALNHISKTRTKIIHHNMKLRRKDEVPDEYRDQGLTRPKVLIMVPFKESALKIVKIFVDLMTSLKKGNVMNKKRFQDEFSIEDPPKQRARKRPDDYEATMVGNLDDMFRVGVAVTKKSLKLYADFYSADIIIASPLGLRTIIGAEGEKDRDFDFLSSIEILILDQTDIFIMQNWSHVLHVLNHMHLQPSDAHNADFSRVRMWSLNGWAKFYRQTIILSGVRNPAIYSLFNKQCFNYSGKIEFRNIPSLGTICQVVVQLPQVFQVFSAPSATDLPDYRFQMFITKILPQFKDSVMSHTMIYIPSYFDFVRVRNYFKKEGTSFVQICEYSKREKIARARDYFFHGERHFLLYTERAHFFNRYVIKGIRHIIFYELPVYPHFYNELCNMLQLSNRKLDQEGEKSDKSCLVLYAPQDAQQLSAVVGKERTSVMLNSDRKVHMFVSGES